MSKFIKLFLLFLLIAGLFLIIKKDKTVAELSPTYGHSFIKVGDLNIHYAQEGNPNDSLPIVLIHGTSSSLHTFNAWANSLKKDRKVIRLDMPGFGLTGPFKDANYSIDHYCAVLNEFLMAKGIDNCILGGNSLGGQIAWNYTLKHPEKINKLILIDAAGYPLVSESVPLAFKIAQIPVLNKLLSVITPTSIVKTSVENVYYDKTKVTDQLVTRYLDMTLRAGNRKALVDRFAAPVDSLAYKAIPSISTSTLILWGKQDFLIPVSHAYRFQEDLPNDTLVVLDKVGHVPMEEVPEESLQAVLAFID